MRQAVIAFVASALVAQAADTRVSITPVKPSILAGEPLFLRLAVRNPNGPRLTLEVASYSLPRVTVGPDGSVWHSRASSSKDGMVPLLVAEPGQAKAVTVVALETVQLRPPGEYRMTIKHRPAWLDQGPDPRFVPNQSGTTFPDYPQPGASSEVSFVVLPYDAAALRKRAEELYEANRNPRSAEHTYAREALVAMDPQVTEPLLCNLLRENLGVFEDELVARLQELATPEVAECLLQVSPDTRGGVREKVLGVLRYISDKTPDRALREKIQRVLPPN